MNMIRAAATAGVVAILLGVAAGAVAAQTSSGTEMQFPATGTTQTPGMIGTSVPGVVQTSGPRVSGTAVPGVTGTSIPGGITSTPPGIIRTPTPGVGGALTPVRTSTPVGGATGTQGTEANLQPPLTATMDGSAEVPGPGVEGAIGSAAVTVDSMSNTVCYALHVVNLGETPSAAHIHRGAVGVAGPVVVPLTAPTDGNSSGCVPRVDADIITDLMQNPADFYVNVHTPNFPDGATRGQLGR
jgi:hypothetical protein